jgi:hypothetical protein
METKTAAIELYSVGLCYASACAPGDAGRDDVEMAANRIAPTGIAPWRVADEPFQDGAANPHACEDDETRKHWLLWC